VVVRKHAFHWRYDTAAELDLLNRLWRLVSVRLNFFTPTRKAIGYTTTAQGRRRHIYDAPATPWQRLQASNLLDEDRLAAVSARIEGTTPQTSPVRSPPSRCSCSTSPRPRPKPSPRPATST